MVNLFLNGWMNAPSWFKCVFILVCAWAIIWIIYKLILIAIAIHYNNKLLRGKVGILFAMRDDIKDYLVNECNWKCVDKDNRRYYTCGPIVLTEKEIFANIINQGKTQKLISVLILTKALNNAKEKEGEKK